MSGAIGKRCWVKRGVLLLLAFTVVCGLASRRPKLPGTLGAVAAEVRIGMSSDEVAALIRKCYSEREQYDGPRLYLWGMTHDGRELNAYFDWQLQKLPPADQIAWVKLDIDDDQGRDLIIILGPGGVVTGLWLESDSIWEGLRYFLARRAELRGW